MIKKIIILVFKYIMVSEYDNLMDSSSMMQEFESLMNTAMIKNKKQLECDRDCQFEKKVAMLNSNLTNAKLDKLNGDKRIALAEKALIEYRDGKEEYKKKQIEKYEGQIKNNRVILEKQNNTIMKELKNMLKLYSNEINNYKNITDLISIKNNIYNKNNNKIKNDIFETSTSERKYYYEDKEYNSLINAKYYLIQSYYIVVLFCFIYLSSKGSYKKYMFWLIMLFLLTLPFFTKYICKLIINIYKFIKLFILSILNMVPHNVYLNID